MVEGGGSVSGDEGVFEAGDPVTLTAAETAGHQFDGWSGYEGLPNVAVNGKVLTFNMPSNHVTVTANFSQVQAPETYALNLNIKHPKNWKDWGRDYKDYADSTAVITTGGASNPAGESITVKATKGTYKEKNWKGQWNTKDLKFDGWYNGNTKVSSQLIYNFNMPANDLILTARFLK